MPTAHTHSVNPWLDNSRRYGRISRFLHWTMALLFAWQFLGMILKVTINLHPRESFIIGTHTHVGFVLLVLMVVRALWAFMNIQRRPSHGTGFVARCASLGHLVIYVLMLVVPLSALLRSWASGRGFSFLTTIPVIPSGHNYPAVTNFINSTNKSLDTSVHGLLGWLLLLVIVGHIAMVIVHQRHWRDGTLNKMLGKPRSDTL